VAIDPPEKKLSDGCPCPKCRTGRMTLEGELPVQRRPGMSELTFRCTVCGEVLRQIEDDRFRN